MSEISSQDRPRRRRRAEARQNVTAILEAAVSVLNERPQASVDDVARAAGVTRQTVYAHYPSRQAIVNAAIDHATHQAVAAMDAAALDTGPPSAAITRFAEAGWTIFERYPLLLQMSDDDPAADQRRHRFIEERLEQLIRRGQDSGDFDAQLPAHWLAAAHISLGHAAGAEVAAGRLTNDEATAALKRSVQKITIAGIDPTG